MWSFTVDATSILVVVAAIQSLFFDYFPKVSVWFDGLPLATKKQLVVSLGILSAIVVFVGQCQEYFNTNLTCSPQSLTALIGNIIIAVATGYAFHKATKPE